MGAFDDLIPSGTSPATQPAAGAFSDLIPGGSMSGVRSGAQDALRGTRKTYDFTESFLAGVENSVPALAVKRPGAQVAEDAGTMGRLGFQVGQWIGDFPVMVLGAGMGGAVGTAGAPGPGTVIGGMAGGFGLPAGLRATLMDAYEKGDFKDFPDFWDRASHIIWETVKGQATGAATAVAGGAVRGATVAAPALVRAVAPTAAEIATMTSVGAALEGRIPSAQEFVDGAIMVGGLKGAVATAGKLRTIYAKTGKQPIEVVAEAKQDPALEKAIIETPQGELPQAYRDAATQEVVRSSVPDPKVNEREALNVSAVISNPEGTVTLDKQPNHINYRYVEGPEDIKAIHARISELYEPQIAEKRSAGKSWETSANEAYAEIGRVLGVSREELDSTVLARDIGKNLSLDSKMLAMKAMLDKSAWDVADASADVRKYGFMQGLPPEVSRRQVEAIQTMAMIQAEFLGDSAEVGRALNILKAAKQARALSSAMTDLTAQYGHNPQMLAFMIGKLGTSEGLAKFAKGAAKAGTFEKVVEAWKAGLLSGPVTHMANLIGNLTFLAMRPIVDLAAAGIGAVKGGPDQVLAREFLGRATGNVMGAIDAFRIAREVIGQEFSPEGGGFMGVVRRANEGGTMGKAEQYRNAIEGTKGEIIRLPFTALSTADGLFRMMNERGEAYALAMRKASSEGFDIQTREYRERVADLVNNPTPDMQKAIVEAGTRFTFNKELGEVGQRTQQLVRAAHLQFLFPFVRTPVNILKELTRMSPAAFAVKDWRADLQAGGAKQAQAIAEVALGTAAMGIVASAFEAGGITGQPDPDPGKRRGQLSSGWQPYSIKVNGTWYSYQRIQPIGTLMGIAADVMSVREHMTDEESDKTGKMLAIAFANAVTNQTMLQGLTQIVNTMTDPERYGERFLQGYAGSIVPAGVSQVAQWHDPLQREINSELDAIKARIPGVREGLLPKRDVYGEEIKAKEKLAAAFPIAVSVPTNDPVRLEAARLGISFGPPPKKMHLGRSTGKIGDVKLTPEQIDKFEEVSGKAAHEIMSTIIDSAYWDTMPDMAKRNAFRRSELVSHKIGAAEALPPDVREQVFQTIANKIAVESQKITPRAQP